MQLVDSTYSLIEFADICIAVKQSEMLTIDQASSVELVTSSDGNMGYFIFDKKRIPTYQLSEYLTPVPLASELKRDDYCIGFKTSNEENYFSIICSKIDKAEISKAISKIQQVPHFMNGEQAVISSLCQYDDKLLLLTTADLLHQFISHNQTEEKLYA